MTLGFLPGSKNFCKLLSVSWEVCVLHGYDWIHWVAKSCTTTAYRWLFRDSQLSLRTLWSAVIKSPKFAARGTAPPMRLLHGALVILVLWQISQFRSLGKWVWTLCLPQNHTSRRRRWFTRRTGVWVSAFRNSVIHQNFTEFLQPFQYVGTQRAAPFPLGFLFMGFGFLLAWSIPGRPDRSSTIVDTVTGKMSLSVRSSRSRVWISLTLPQNTYAELIPAKKNCSCINN